MKEYYGLYHHKMIIDELRARGRYLKNLKPKLEDYLSRAPDGRLRIVKTGVKKRYYLIENPEDRNGRYLSAAEYEIARRIAQKRYVQNVLKNVLEDLRAIEGALSALKNSPEQVYDDLSDDYRELVIPIEPTDEQFINDWYAKHKGHRNPLPIEGDLITDRGERVRSKSELIIANLLNAAGIPYVYEAELCLKGVGTIYPDFTILNVRLRKTIYWEHQGKMDDPEYADKAVAKTAAYISSGLFPGDDLIVTSETSKRSLSTSVLRAIIERYLN